jgi:hypothetical protein
MSDGIPLGQAEGQKLEFKGKDALKHLPNVSREVVAMLNSEGGEVWIGLGEESGRAVRSESIEHPNREINRLRDHFSDAIEPSPIQGEIRVEAFCDEAKGSVLKVSANPSAGRKPFALREGTARHFLKRVDDRLRSMAREEIIPRRAGFDSARRDALRKIRNAQGQERSRQRFWLRIQPVGGGKLNLGKNFDDYFRDSRKTGNRSIGWNFVDPYQRLEREGNGIRFGLETCVRVFSDGAIDFTMPIINLYWKSVDGVSRAAAKEIWPYCLLEYPASIFRLASTIYKDHHFDSDTFLADLVLFGLRDWTLRPHSPVSFGYKLANPKPFEFDEIVLDEPTNFTSKQIRDEPDRCAFRLVTQVYWSFGLWEEDMPVEFNQDTGKLVLPEA